MSREGNLYSVTTFNNGGRRAGTGILYDNYDDESGPGVSRGGRKWNPVRLPHDSEKPESLNGPVIIVKKGERNKQP